MVQLSYFLCGVLLLTAPVCAEEKPIPLGSRLHLLIDDVLIESLSGDVQHKLHHPIRGDVVLKHDKPWEGNGCNYHTVFQDGDLYRLYYRGAQLSISNGKLAQGHGQVTCYAESRDGIHWEKPELGLFEWDGSKANNIIWKTEPTTHNFTPFKDTRPGVPKTEQYKAFGSSGNGKGLAALASADGIRWRLLTPKPVITKGAFDSQNLAYWDSLRGEYRAYYRDFKDGFRDIRTATSKDFLTWSEGEWLTYPNAAREHLYTNQIKPYYRAPDLLIGLPTRYADRQWSENYPLLPDAENRKQRTAIVKRYGTSFTDTLLMTSRDGNSFRRWKQAFISPGAERPGTWNYGHLYTAWGLVETAPKLKGTPRELSIYTTEGGWTGKECQLRRHTLRIDGFVSLTASNPGGEMRTKPVTFQGKELVLNLATSIIGYVRVEIRDLDGKPIPGFTLNESVPMFGNSIERTVLWKNGSDVSSLQNRPVRLRFVLKDIDLYSLRFR